MARLNLTEGGQGARCSHGQSVHARTEGRRSMPRRDAVFCKSFIAAPHANGVVGGRGASGLATRPRPWRTARCGHPAHTCAGPGTQGYILAPACTLSDPGRMRG